MNNAKESSSPRVSVFVPSYNHAQFVEQCLKSILKQTRAPNELLVVDDGSKDNSVEIIEKLLTDCSFPCELIARPNKGLCTTLNEGLEKTSGDYFAYLGSDDLWLAEFLESRVNLLESRGNAVLAYGHAYTIDEHNRVIESTQDWNSFSDGDVRQMLSRGIAPISSTVCYRRSALAKYGWNEAARLEDFELYLYLSREGKFAFDPRALSAWRLHGENTSHDANMMLEECLAAHHRVAKDLGLDEKELNKALAETSLEYALMFARRQQKTKALSLLFRNILTVRSVSRPVKILGHCLLPLSLKKKFNERKSQSADNRFKAVSLDVR